MRLKVMTMTWRKYWTTIPVTVLMLCATAVNGQIKPQRPVEKTRLLFLLDGSGSMLEKWGRPNETKLSVARSILSRIIDSLRQDNKIELALRVYGHQYAPGQNNCKDTKLEVPFSPKNHSVIIDKMYHIQPKGVTPISYALLQAAQDFPTQAGYRNILILITDGIESCGGDPCAISLALQRKGVFLQPYIIGLGMAAEKSLECAGNYLNADTPGRFFDILNDAIEKSFAQTTVSVHLIGLNQKRETNINVSFLDKNTGSSANEFVNYLDRNGEPDTIQVDPLIRYDLMVSTLPPIIKRDVGIEQGRHTTVRIPVLQGNLLIKQEGTTTSSLQAIVREKGKGDVLHVQRFNETVRYLSGAYDVEVLTLPRRTFQAQLQPDKTFTLVIPQAGVVNFNSINTGYGALYEVKNDGTQEWVCTLDNQKLVFALTLLPGQYRVAFRVKNSPGSKYTTFKNFTVKAGKTHHIEIFK
jgi:Ca-activated chloride channel homolog